MYQSATARAHPPRAAQQPGMPAQAQPAGIDAPELEPAATLASRAAIGSETTGADGKAALVLTMLGLMFTVLARFGPELGAALHGRSDGSGVIRVTCATLLIGFIGCALCAVVQAFRTITPRFRKDKPSLAFFAEIARLDREAYFERVESMTMREAVGQILTYNHTAATICAEKYTQLRRALRFFEAAAACWLVLAVILAFRSLMS